MRVALVNERMLRGFGVDLVIDAVASEMATRGHDVTVYASTTEELGPHPYRLERIPTRASGVFPRYEHAAKRWAPFIDDHDHDIVFVESFPFFSLIPRLRTPTVAVDYGVSPSSGLTLFQKINFAYMRLSQQHLFFPRARAVVVCSKFVRSLLPQRAAGRAHVIYPGLDHYREAEASGRQDMRSRLGLRQDQSVLLYVGRLNPEGQPYKGTADLMNAASRWRSECPALRVVMAGRGDEADAKRIREAGAIPLLNFPASEMADLYAAADCYLTASRWEGFDLPLMEAAYQGVPGVALNVGAHGEVVRDGETGLLTRNVGELVQTAETLAGDCERLRSIGSAAKKHAQEFTWARAVDAYESLAREAGNGAAIRSPVASPIPAPTPTGSAAAATGAKPSLEATSHDAGNAPSNVTAIVLNYGAGAEVLRKCVASIVAQTYPVEILVVDNASPRNQEAPDELRAEWQDVRVLKLSRNYGFAGGMNRGVDAASTEFVLLLNNDVVLAPNAVAEMRRVIDLEGDTVGVAPKILLESDPHVIDAIGNLIDASGMAFNMGIGQLDVGQYDRIERTFGACFAATLLRRTAFRPGLVGRLDERFFMYYEDVDWCFRANVLGLKFLTAPAAVVHHTHSLTTRDMAYSFKYRLIMRNFLWTVARNFSRDRAWRAVARRIMGMSRGVLRGPYRWANVMALSQALLGLPLYLAARSRVQGRRRIQDKELFDFSHGEMPFFDPENYAPQRRLETLIAMYRRLFLLSGKEEHSLIAETAKNLAATRLRFDTEFAKQKLRPLVANEPAYVQQFVESLEF